MEVAAAVLYPFLLKITWQNCDLVGSGTDFSFKADPVGIGGDTILVPCGNVLKRRHTFALGESVLVSRAVVGQFNFRFVTHKREVGAIEETAVGRDIGIGTRIDEALVLVPQRKVQCNLSVRQQRLGELANIET